MDELDDHYNWMFKLFRYYANKEKISIEEAHKLLTSKTFLYNKKYELAHSLMSPNTFWETFELASAAMDKLQDEIYNVRDARLNDMKRDHDIRRVVVSSFSPNNYRPITAFNGPANNIHKIFRAYCASKGLNIGELPEDQPLKALYFNVGRCAEQHIASKYLNKIKHPQFRHIKEIKFGPAIRLRDWNIYDYCGTCRLIFDQLNDYDIQ